MSHPPFKQAGSLHIGVVDFVSPDEIKVLLDIEAPESVALNAGGPRPFPRINGYVLIPVDDCYLVGQIEWITVERSAFPKRRGMQDFGLVDLPYPLRKMSLNPLGTLRKIGNNSAPEKYRFRRGADALPTIGATVLIPSDLQLRSIVESGAQRRVKIGTTPLAANADVYVDPDRLFGRHLAVLGNTGSGKSCSVAGLIRWSLEQAKPDDGSQPNARFIILDPNGEYSRSFKGDGAGATKARVFKVEPGAETEEILLRVPLWFWNSAEWCSFTQATARAQRPLLKRALREIKSGRSNYTESSEEHKKLRLRRSLSSILTSLKHDIRSGSIRSEARKFGLSLVATHDDLFAKISDHPDCDIASIVNAICDATSACRHDFPDRRTGENVKHFDPFTEEQINAIVTAIDAVITGLGGIILPDGPDEDVPIHFSGHDFVDHLETLAEHEGATQYVEFLVARIRTFLSDTRMRSITGDSPPITLQQWLEDYIGSNDQSQGCISVIDLSLVPTEVVHIIAAVIARITFDALQRYRKINGETLPTVLVMEEAHTFVRRYKDDVDHHDAATICCQVFERIAREGRKFGLGLVLSSQRPSELSQTVLSQCNTFLLHRISNDRDQEQVQKLVPDNLRGLLRELPSLPSQHAILLGWASELPVLVKMNDLPKSHQPHSDDPDFWNVWTRRDAAGEFIDRPANWTPVADDWQGTPEVPEAPDEEFSYPDDDEDDCPF